MLKETKLAVLNKAAQCIKEDRCFVRGMCNHIIDALEENDKSLIIPHCEYLSTLFPHFTHKNYIKMWFFIPAVRGRKDHIFWDRLGFLGNIRRYLFLKWVIWKTKKEK